MDALKKSLAREGAPASTAKSEAKRGKAAPAKGNADRRQVAMLLPVSGGGKKKEAPAAAPAASSPRGRKKAS